mmetsp:Transcript_27368/g.24133  ORF Transcript_27368/g.24133 Transcript_27368/m.24133 type:complete len:106 (-) Transcript_27368:263-580(-)
MNEQLSFYGLYKQATIGDCNISKPSITNMTATKKWEAWNAHKGHSSDEAKRLYIQCCINLVPDSREKIEAMNGGDEDDIFMSDEEFLKKRNERKGRNIGANMSKF